MNRRAPHATLSWHELGEIELYLEDPPECPETGDDAPDVDHLADRLKLACRVIRDLCAERDADGRRAALERALRELVECAALVDVRRKRYSGNVNAGDDFTAACNRARRALGLLP